MASKEVRWIMGSSNVEMGAATSSLQGFFWLSKVPLDALDITAVILVWILQFRNLVNHGEKLSSCVSSLLNPICFWVWHTSDQQEMDYQSQLLLIKLPGNNLSLQGSTKEPSLFQGWAENEIVEYICKPHVCIFRNPRPWIAICNGPNEHVSKAFLKSVRDPNI